MNTTKGHIIMAVAGVLLGASLAETAHAQQPKSKSNPATQSKKDKKKKKDVHYEYIVTEYNPFTKGVYDTPRRFTDEAEANENYDALRNAHWVQWRFAGINEPLRWRRFSSSTAARRFIDTDGPSKTGALGFAILTDETKVVPGDVRLTKEEVVTEEKESDSKKRGDRKSKIRKAVQDKR
jgi:hypothetical protein